MLPGSFYGFALYLIESFVLNLYYYYEAGFGPFLDLGCAWFAETINLNSVCLVQEIGNL